MKLLITGVGGFVGAAIVGEAVRARRKVVGEVVLSDQTLIGPKLGMGRSINDQYPYLPPDEYQRGNRFVCYPRPAALRPGGNA
jgi:nucleoside-diphosphate-sugar epimerase